MHVIGISSRKGGSGKTTSTSHLAVTAEAAGAGPVAVIDTDPQGGLAGWWNARAVETPRWIDPTHGLPAAVSAARTTGYGLLLIVRRGTHRDQHEVRDRQNFRNGLGQRRRGVDLPRSRR
jgi:cellulose biosynthesis protein BcsQ